MCFMCRKSMFVDIHITDADGVKVLCPNHILAELAAGHLKMKPVAHLKDELQGTQGAVRLVASGGKEEYVLKPDTMRRLINHSLYKAEWRGLAKLRREQRKVSGYWDLPYMIHSDFYGEDGTAWQPVLTNPELTRLYHKELRRARS